MPLEVFDPATPAVGFAPLEDPATPVPPAELFPHTPLLFGPLELPTTASLAPSAQIPPPPPTFLIMNTDPVVAPLSLYGRASVPAGFPHVTAEPLYMRACPLAAPSGFIFGAVTAPSIKWTVPTARSFRLIVAVGPLGFTISSVLLVFWTPWIPVPPPPLPALMISESPVELTVAPPAPPMNRLSRSPLTLFTTCPDP